MPITMIFGTEEYTMGPHLHAKFGPHWGWRGYTNSRSWELFKNRGFRGYTALSLSFSLPPSPCSLPIPLLTLPSARDCHISVIVQATPWTIPENVGSSWHVARQNDERCIGLMPSAPSTPATMFDFVERIVRLVAFDNVASTLLMCLRAFK